MRPSQLAPVGEGALALPQFGHVLNIAQARNEKPKGKSDEIEVEAKAATPHEGNMIAESGAEPREG